MDEDTRNRLFEPFFTTKFTGRGLGMSATRGIIKAHNGALQCSSQSGLGTTFKIYLPIQLQEYCESVLMNHVAPTQWQGSGLVLLVEDEAQIAFLANAMLQQLGFIVIAAAHGKEALELYHQHASDIVLVLTDMGMPVMDGYALFRELKNINPELPIVISSGFGDTVVTTRIPNEEIAGMVNKPYRFDQLRDVLKRVVEGVI
jgi:CheY-like chemotaxis protein